VRVPGPAERGPVEPGAQDPGELSAEDAVDIDLVPPSLLLPKVQRAVLLGLLVVVPAAVAVALLLGPVWGQAVLLVGAVPGVLGYIGAIRRRVVIDHRVVTSRRLRTRRVNLIAADEVVLLARTAQITEIAVRISEGGTVLRVPLALYADPRHGPLRARELQSLGMRRLGEALTGNGWVDVAEVGRALLEQARTQTTGVPVRERPLYRAAVIARFLPGRAEVEFSRDEIAEISLS
jgi:hypothetical protein